MPSDNKPVWEMTSREKILAKKQIIKEILLSEVMTTENKARRKTMQMEMNPYDVIDNKHKYKRIAKRMHKLYAEFESYNLEGVPKLKLRVVQEGLRDMWRLLESNLKEAGCWR